MLEDIDDGTTLYRNVRVGEVKYEFYSANIGFQCTCGNNLIFSDGGYAKECECGRTYRMRHYLEVAIDGNA